MARSCAALLSLGLLAFTLPAQAGEIPEAIRKAGVVKLSINAIYPPMEYKEPGTDKLIGVDLDLGDTIADVLAGLIADGGHGRIMAKWSLPGNAVPAVLINSEPRK